MQIQRRSMYYYNENIPNNHLMMSSSSTLSCIQHPISKLDTLAGIAIKYGVEVADIKKVNGLVTDRQMFALKTIDIPLNGKHPPPHSTTGHDNTEPSPADNASCELFESFHSLRRMSSENKHSPVMTCLRSHYGTEPTMKKSSSEMFSTMDYEKRGLKSSENGSFHHKSPVSQPLNHHQKSHSLANGALDDDIMEVVEASKSDTQKRNGTVIRRCYKSEANLQCIPELLLKQDNNSIGGFSFSPRSAKGLAQRQKSGNRIAFTAYSNHVV